MIDIITAICILDPSKTKTDFTSDEKALEYIYSNTCDKCKKSIEGKSLNYILDTPCCFGFWWVEDDDDI